MDPGSIAMLIPVSAIVAGAAVKIAKLRFGNQTHGPRDGGCRENRCLGGGRGQLRQELTETQERLDFTERLLAKGREGKQLG